MLQHPPYGPEDLTEPPKSGPDFIKQLLSQKQERYPEAPPFYKALLDGTLKRDALELWIKNGYYYWDPMLQFSTAAIYIKTNAEATRSHMLKKCVTIEGREIVNDLVGWTTPAYEELWLRFGEAMGVKRDDIVNWKPLTRSYFASCTLALCSRWWEWTWLDGLAALYAYDLVTKEFMSQVHDALKRHYGASDEALEIFRATVGDSTEDIPWEEESLSHYACTIERQLTASRAFRYRLDIEYQYLVPLNQFVTTGNVPLQIP